MAQVKDITNKRFFEIIEEVEGGERSKLDILNLISLAYRASANDAYRIGCPHAGKAQDERAHKIYKTLHDMGYYADIEAEADKM